jgi:hypothetical protein
VRGVKKEKKKKGKKNNEERIDRDNKQFKGEKYYNIDIYREDQSRRITP